MKNTQTLPAQPHGFHVTAAHLLIVDDDPANIRLLQTILWREGYRNVHYTTNPCEVEELCRELQPDLMLLDLLMPDRDGFTVMEQLRQNEADKPFMPILVLTSDVSPETRSRALAGGAHDFLTKPFDYSEVVLRIRNLLSLHFLHQQLHHQNLTLEERVCERTREVEESRQALQDSHRALQESQIEVLERLMRAAEFRDDDTGQHTQRVGRYCALVAQRLGFSAPQVEIVRWAAPLHDVGKIGIPDAILLKPGRLTPEEFEIMKTHATIGANLLSGGCSELMRMAAKIARSHHERWDGTGYPDRLCGEAIPLVARIASVVDVFDALTHQRPYKEAWPVARAVQEIINQKGAQFDPRVVEAFLEVVRGCGEWYNETQSTADSLAASIFQRIKNSDSPLRQPPSNLKRVG